MWLIVPPPLGWDFQLVAWLQSSSVQMASRLLDVAGVRHLLDGNVLVLPGQRMLADEAYHGVHAMPVLLTVAALFVVASRRPLLWAAVLVAASVASAWLVNVARVVTSALSQAWDQFDLASGPGYELLGHAAILLGLALLASTDRWLAFLLRAIAARDGQLPLPLTSVQNPMNRAWNWLVGARRQTNGEPQAGVAPQTSSGRRKGRRRRGGAPRAASDAVSPRHAGGLRDVGWLSAFGLCGFLQIACLLVPAVWADAPSASAPRWDGPLPAELGEWTLAEQERVERKHNDQAGRFSHQWWYRREPLACQISVNHPVPDWHDPMNCYAANGWQQTARRVATDVAAGEGEQGRGGLWVEMELAKPTGEYGWLRFGLFDPAGGNLLPPSAARWPSVTAELARSPLGSRLLGRGQGRATETAYQLQAFVSSTVRLSPQQQAEVRRLLVAARAEVLSADLPEAEEAEREP
jgi:exosortase/archaeosortase family protein